jgi:hypothetical protein
MIGEASNRPVNDFTQPPQPAEAQPKPMPSFRFAGFTLRPAIDSDILLADYWVSADPEHRLTTKATFWIEQSATANSFLLEDRDGAVFFFKIVDEGNRTLAIHIQFGPDNSAQMRTRIMDGLTTGFAWLQKRLMAMGYEAVYFNSNNPGLIYFSQKRLGFVWDGRKLIRRIDDGKAECKETQRAAQQ